MNTPVSFELAKLLKEKGFNGICKNIYAYGRENQTIENLSELDNNNDRGYWLAPTIAEVVMWIHKEKGLWINVIYMGFELKYSWSIDIITTSGSNWDSYGEEDDVYYNSPTEAYEAAIEHTLKNLI